MIKYLHKIQAFVFTSCLSSVLAAQAPYVQFVHVSADTVNLPNLDLYIGGNEFVSDLGQYSATALLELAGPGVLALAVASGSSSSPSDAVLAMPMTFMPNRHYTIYIYGRVNSATDPLSIVKVEHEDIAPSNSDKASVSFAHFAAGVEPVHVVLRDGPMIVNGVGYGQVASRVMLATEDQYLDVKFAAGPANLIGTYRLSLQSYQNTQVKVFALPNAQPDVPLRLLALFPTGLVLPLDLSPLARVQYINALRDTVDVFKNGSRFSDNAAHGAAMPYKNLPAGIPMNISISAYTNSSASLPFAPYGTFTFVFENMQKYLAVSAGSVDNPEFPLEMFFADGVRETSEDTNLVDICLFNAAAGVSNVSLGADGENWFEDIAYGTFAEYRSVAPSVYTVQVAGMAQACPLDISNAKGRAMTLFTTRGTTAGPLELWAADRTGTSTLLCSALVGGADPGPLANLEISPNPARESLRLTGVAKMPGKFLLQIFDAQSQRCFTGMQMLGAQEAFSFFVPMADWPAGLYYLTLATERGDLITKKFAVAR